MTKRKTGRVDVAFENIEAFAATHRSVLFDGWTLQRTSSVHRRKDGSLTVSLQFKGEDGIRATQTVRGVRAGK